MKDAIRTTSLSITNTGEQDASIIYLNFPEGSLRWVGMPGWDRFRINDNTVALIANEPLAPNKKADMLFKLDELDIDPETDVDVALAELVGDTVGVETDPVGPFDDELDTFNSSTMPRVIMEDPRLPFPFKPMELQLPPIPLNELPSDFELDLDCIPDPEPITGEDTSIGELEGIGVTEGVTVGVEVEIEPEDLGIDAPWIPVMDSTSVDWKYINSDAGLEIVFPEGWSGAEMPRQMFGDKIPLIPFVTIGSVQSNDKIELKMHKNKETAGNPAVSGKALVLVPIGTSCVMSFDAEEEGLPLPFHLGSVLSLPEGLSTIEIELDCTITGECEGVADVKLQGDAAGDCDGVAVGIDDIIDIELDPPVPIPPNTPVNILEEAGLKDVKFKEKIELEVDCELEGEAVLVGDGDVAGPFDGIEVEVYPGSLQPFNIEKNLQLPHGRSTIKIEPKCEPGADECFLILDFLEITILSGQCTLNSLVIDRMPLNFPPIPLPTNKPVDILEEIGTEEIEISDTLTIDVDCETSGEAEATLEGDADGDTDVDVDVVGIGVGE
jgi:hypothetical protein